MYKLIRFLHHVNSYLLLLFYFLGLSSVIGTVQCHSMAQDSFSFFLSVDVIAMQLFKLFILN